MKDKEDIIAGELCSLDPGDEYAAPVPTANWGNAAVKVTTSKSVTSTGAAELETATGQIAESLKEILALDPQIFNQVEEFSIHLNYKVIPEVTVSVKPRR